MNGYFSIGNIIKVDSSSVTILVKDFTHLETIHYDGTIYKGISVGTFVGVIRGSDKIVVQIISESIDNIEEGFDDSTLLKNKVQRKLVAKIIGVIRNREYETGIKTFPLMFDDVVLLNEEELKKIYYLATNKGQNTVELGQALLYNDFEISVPISGLFDTHIGIFGNTGSGKSNTLAKLYKTLFDKIGKDKLSELNSNFVFIDFHNEYSKYFEDDNYGVEKYGYKNKKWKINGSLFWTYDFLSSLFDLSNNDDTLFINAFLRNREFLEKYKFFTIELFFNAKKPIKNFFENFVINRCFVEIRKILNSKKFDFTEINDLSRKWLKMSEEISNILKGVSNTSTIFLQIFTEVIRETLKLDFPNKSMELMKIYINLIISYFHFFNRSLSYANIHNLMLDLFINLPKLFEYIEIDKTTEPTKGISIILLKDYGNLWLKRSISTIIAKQLFENNKNQNSNLEYNHTTHFIIDEAHNLLSDKLLSETANANIIRLNLFEQFIKEGRKFGFFLTISTQDPWSLHSGITSQLSNFFIHRFLSEYDMEKMKKYVANIDDISYNKISILDPGQCVLWGAKFKTPIMIKVEKLKLKDEKLNDKKTNLNPLEKLWGLSRDSN